ncbi:MAG: type IV pilus assembly protein PilM [Gemmataceae bacterium]|nr:type IV pilus assembly protein PilM [Gemmataceae bacterium]
MAIKQGVWGIDVGQCALKALRLEMIDGTLTATAFDYIEHPKILSQPDADPDQLTREALETFLSRNSIKGDIVAMSVAGQSGLARFVKLPPVEEKKIADIVRFEAKQQIPFPLEEVVWDFQKIGSGTVTDGFAMDTEIGLFAMKRDLINRFLHHFQAANIEVHIVQMAQLALCNYVSYDLLRRKADGTLEENVEVPDDTPPGKKRCAVALDIGTDNSSLIITDGDRIIWQRPIPIGGNHFTRALTKEMKLTFAKAEHLKRNAAKSPDLAKILKALKPVLTDFVNEVQRSLGYFTNTHRDAHIAFMVGLGSAFRLPGLQKFLAEKLGLDVRRPNVMERLSGDAVVSAPAFAEHILTFPVAYGLCLQGLNLARLTTNLLPHEIRIDRMIRAKKPWSVAAAAAMLLGVGVVSLGFGMKSQSLGQPKDPDKYRGDKVADACLKVEGAVKAAQQNKSAAEQRRRDIDTAARDVKSIIAGTDERSNWIRLNEFISQTLPRPDGSNMFDFTQARPRFNVNQKKYVTPAAREAAEQFQRRWLGDSNVADRPMDDEHLRHLINIDVEGVFTMYVDDLKAFYQMVQKRMMDESQEDIKSSLDLFVPYGPDGQPQTKYSEALPEGPGWIVEVRGHTYNLNGRNFLLDTIVFNTNRLGFGKGLVPFSETSKGEAITKGPFPDPIEGRISHAFLYKWRQVPNPQPGAFEIISGSHLRSLLGGGSGGGRYGGGESEGMGGASAMFQAGGGGDAGGVASIVKAERASWAPLGAGAAAGAGAGMMAGGGEGMGGYASRAGGQMALLRSGPVGVGGGGGAGAAAPPPMSAAGGAGATTPSTPGLGQPPGSANLARPSNRNRYEFVMMFVWREPLGVDSSTK